jgi:hypothetical protein
MLEWFLQFSLDRSFTDIFAGIAPTIGVLFALTASKLIQHQIEAASEKSKIGNHSSLGLYVHSIHAQKEPIHIYRRTVPLRFKTDYIEPTWGSGSTLLSLVEGVILATAPCWRTNLGVVHTLLQLVEGMASYNPTFERTKRRVK